MLLPQLVGFNVSDSDHDNKVTHKQETVITRMCLPFIPTVRTLISIKRTT